jgi:hypothetical protein
LNKLKSIQNWRLNKDLFTREELAVLSVTETVDLLPDKNINGLLCEEIILLFGEEMASRIILAAVTINMLNKFGLTLDMALV